METFGPYNLLRLLGAGVTGEVHEAVHQRGGPRVALKRLHARLARDHVAGLRFRREYKAASRIQHPHVIRVMEGGRIQSVPFFTMELLPGTNLRAAVGRGPVAPPRMAAVCAWLAQVAEGLHALHAAGVVHRDVKPENILMRGNDEAVITDLGLARMGEDAVHTGGGTILGSFRYVAPEIIQGAPATDASDAYAFGVMAHELLRGRPPHEGTEPQVLLAHVDAEPPRLCSVHAAVPAAVGALVDGLLAKDPGQRPTLPRVAAALRRVEEEVAAAVPAAPLHSTFVGRAEELRRIMQRVDTLAEPGPRVVLVQGAQGLGKSALLREVVRQAVRAGCATSTGRADPVLSAPYLLWRGPVEHLCRRMKLNPPAFDGVRGVRSPDHRNHVWAQMRTLLESITELSRLVICLDDVDRADELSLWLLSRLGEPNMARLRVLVVASAESPARVLRPFSTPDASVMQLALGPLSRAESKQLALAAGPEVTEELMEPRVEDTGGVPSRVVEKALELREERVRAAPGAAGAVAVPPWAAEPTADEVAAAPAATEAARGAAASPTPRVSPRAPTRTAAIRPRGADAPKAPVRAAERPRLPPPVPPDAQEAAPPPPASTPPAAPPAAPSTPQPTPVASPVVPPPLPVATMPSAGPPPLPTRPALPPPLPPRPPMPPPLPPRNLVKVADADHPAPDAVAWALAVMGTRAPSVLLLRVLDAAEESREGGLLKEALAQLEQKQFLIQVAGGLWDFPTDHLRAETYARVPAPLKKHLHGRAAAAIRDTAPWSPANAEVQAYHLVRAGEHEAAAGMLLEAAQAALDVWATEKAESLVTRAVDALAQLKMEGPTIWLRAAAVAPDLATRLALVNLDMLSGRGVAAPYVAACTEAQALSAAGASPGPRCDVELHLADAQLMAGHAPAARDAVARAAVLADAAADPGRAALVDLARIRVDVATATPVTRNELAEALVHARRSGDTDVLLRCILAVADVHLDQGRPAAAARQAADVLRRTQGRGHALHRLAARRLQAAAWVDQGHLADARQALTSHAADAEVDGFVQECAAGLVELARVHARGMHLGLAVSATGRALKLAREIGHPALRVEAACVRACTGALDAVVSGSLGGWMAEDLGALLEDVRPHAALALGWRGVDVEMMRALEEVRGTAAVDVASWCHRLEEGGRTHPRQAFEARAWLMVLVHALVRSGRAADAARCADLFLVMAPLAPHKDLDALLPRL